MKTWKISRTPNTYGVHIISRLDTTSGHLQQPYLHLVKIDCTTSGGHLEKGTNPEVTSSREHLGGQCAISVSGDFDGHSDRVRDLRLLSRRKLKLV